MREALTSDAPDLRAGRFLSSLRRGKGLSPEQMAPLCGISASSIRNAERGTYPHLDTQERIAVFFGLDKAVIWRERPPIQPRRTVSEKAVMAVEAGAQDETAQALLSQLPEADRFAFGIAWAVIRGQLPYAGSEAVAHRAMAAIEAAGHGTTGTARIGA